MTESKASPNCIPPAGEPLGARLRAIRQMRRLSLVKLGEMSGLSASFISQLERGLCNASFGTLRQIADALGITLGQIFGETPPSPVRLLRKEDRPQLISGAARKFMLTVPPLTHLETFSGEFEPGSSTGSEPYAHGDSQELFVVIRGDVTVEVDGEAFELHEGDSLEYRSSQMHRTWNHGEAVAEVLWIVSPVTVSTSDF